MFGTSKTIKMENKKADILILHEELKGRIAYLESLSSTAETKCRIKEATLLLVLVQKYAISHLTKKNK